MRISIPTIALALLVACSPDNTGTNSTPDTPAASQSSSPSAAPPAATQESLESSRCRMAAQSMIDIAGQAANDTSSRPERREARRVLYEDWTARLAAGEDPCAVYEDIGRAATTF